MKGFSIKHSALFMAGCMMFSAALLYGADDNIDSLFENPPEDIIVEDSEVDHRESLEKSDKILLKGHFSARGAISFGWDDYPDPGNITEGLGISPGADSTAGFSFDARPSSVMTIAGNVQTEIEPDDGINEWTSPTVEELYADYNWLDRAYFRVGKYTITWGQGRLFTPGNLMEDSEDGTALRVNIPTLLDGVSLVTLADDSLAGSDGKLSAGDLVAGALADKVLGGVRLSAGARYQEKEGLRGLWSFKTVLWKIDFLSDLVVYYNENNSDSDYKTNYEVLAGFFREWEDFKLYGEYCYDNRTEGGRDHIIGLAAGYKDIFGSPFDTGIEWRHSFYNDSGRVMPGITWNPWKHIKTGIALPVYYGDPYSGNLIDEDDDVPKGRKVALLFSLELSSSF